MPTAPARSGARLLLLRSRTALVGLALVSVTLEVYLPSIGHAFLDYDDQEYVTENPMVRAGLTLRGLIWAFGFHASNWHPLTWLSHMLDCQLYGLDPAGHHFMNVLLHVANSLLLFLLLNRVTNALWPSAAVAALFAWHPAHVESVAWVAERKDVLCAFFWLLTIWAYLESRVPGESKVQGPKSRVLFVLSLLFFTLALLSKPMAVTLPFVLLLLDFWPLGKVAGCRLQAAGWGGTSTQLATCNLQPATVSRLVFEKWPFFLLTLIACVLTLAAQQRGYAVVSTVGLPLGQRLLHALVAYCHYLAVTFVPRHLSVYYPYDTDVPIGKAVLSAIIILGVSAVALRLALRRRYLLVGWFWFLGTLVPVIGVVQVGDQAWADRYTYLPLIGLFIALTWAAADLLKAKPRASAGLIPVGAGLLLLLLPLTSSQLSNWKDTRALFEHANDVIPRNHLAITVLGSLLAKEGKLEEAIKYYHQALSLKPGYPEAHFFLGNAFEQQAKLEEAIAEYQKALPSKPIREQTHVLLGAAFAKHGTYESAATNYLAALKINPDSPSAHNGLARLLQTQGRLDEAVRHYSAALKFDPALAPAHNNLGILLLQKGDLPQALVHLRESARLQPGNPQTQLNLALALNEQENWTEAVGLFAKSITALPNDAKAHYQFGLALAHLGRTREAMSQYASALLLNPDFPEALDALSWILATAPEPELRNGPESVRMAKRACELTGQKEPAKLRTLAAAYAEVGRFEEAATNLQKALDFHSNSPAQASEQLMLEAFKAHKPWRSPQNAP